MKTSEMKTSTTKRARVFKSRLPPILWLTQTQWFASLTVMATKTRPELTRFVSCIANNAGKWMLVGIETTAPLGKLTEEQALPAVLDAHAHQQFGPFDSFEQAKTEGEKFLHELCQTEGSALELCRCEAIKPSRRRARVRDVKASTS